MANPLGECKDCHAPLCISGRTVVCSKCRTPVPGHPAVADIPSGPPPAPVIPAQHYASSVPDRVNTLERIVADQAARLARLEDRLASRIEAVPALGVASVTTPAPAPLPVRRK